MGSKNVENKADQILQEKRKKKVKGDPRIVIECSEVESVVFGHEKDPEKVFGRRKNRAARGVHETGDWKSVDMEENESGNIVQRIDTKTSDGSTNEDEDYVAGVSIHQEEDYGYGGGKIRPPQSKSDINGSVGGEKGWAERLEETEDSKCRQDDEIPSCRENKFRVNLLSYSSCLFGIEAYISS